MVRRTVLSPTPKRLVEKRLGTLAEAIKRGDTTPTGNKDLGEHGNISWGRNDGEQVTIRDIDEELSEATGRIEGALEDLGETQVRLDSAEQAVTQVESELDNLANATIPSIVDDLEAADQAAQTALGELDTRLTSIDAVGTGELATIRDALTAAQDAVDAAQQVATEANTAANAASQAALEAAGIAESKGRVIVSETEPVGEDRKSSNIWIKPVPDDPDTEVEEKAVTYVYIEASNEWQATTSSELAQAAQNALDAREAAQQAQQRADTAIANASAAQSVAEAAQQTADQATVDAREAHNGAVAAQERVEAKIASGDSLVLNGSFEVDDTNWGAVAGRFGPIESADAHTGARVMELTPATVNAYPLSDPFPVTEGHTYQVRMWYRYMPGDRASRLSAYYQQRDKAGDLVRSYYATDEEGKSILLFADDLVEDEWTLFAGLIEIDPGVTHLRVAPHALGASTDVFHIDDVQVVDVTEARKAQARADEAYAEAAKKLDESQVDAKITASANGKNSITVSANAPSGDGVVAGDVWWQRDGDSNIFGQWVWSPGSGWIAQQIRSEVIANLDVHKLIGTSGEFETFFAQNFTANDAVVEQLWTDQLVGRSATLQSLTVTSGNLIPNGDLAAGNEFWDGAGTVGTISGVDGYSRALSHDGGSIRPYTGPNFLMTAGRQYLFECWIRADKPNSRIYVELRDQDNALVVGAGEIVGGGSGSNASYLMTDYTVPTAWTHYQMRFTARPGTQTASLNAFYFNHRNGSEQNAKVWITGMSLRPATGAVLIEDGAITTPKLTVTEDMSAAIVNAMSVNTKKLVVTEEAILNHATLIGQTVVDDINVQGKLIGTDGVFTGTVDFENVNVTGLQLVEKLEANSISADLIEGGHFTGETFEGGTFVGGEFRTSDNLPGQVRLADDAYVTHLDGGGVFPGLRITPADASNFSHLPAIGPGEYGLTIYGGRGIGGGSSIVQCNPTESFMRTFYGSGGTAGSIQTSTTASLMRTYREDGTIGAALQVDPDSSRMRSYSGNSSEMGWVQVQPKDAELAYVAPNNTYFSRIRADANEAFLYTRAGGGYRYLTVDANGVWVKEAGWEDIDLTAPFRSKWVTMSYPSGYTHPHGAPLAYYRVGKRMYWRGRFAKTDGTPFKAGEFTALLTLKQAFRPEYTTGLSTPSSGTSLTRIEVSSGSGKITATPNANTSWVSIDGLAYDLP